MSTGQNSAVAVYSNIIGALTTPNASVVPHQYFVPALSPDAAMFFGRQNSVAAGWGNFDEALIKRKKPSPLKDKRATSLPQKPTGSSSSSSTSSFLYTKSQAACTSNWGSGKAGARNLPPKWNKTGGRGLGTSALGTAGALSLRSPKASRNNCDGSACGFVARGAHAEKTRLLGEGCARLALVVESELDLACGVSLERGHFHETGD